MISKGKKQIGYIYKIADKEYKRKITGISEIKFKAFGLPLKNYNIYGDTKQNTYPSPDSPQKIESVGDLILPEEYQQVEYIESTGTQYIDTGIYPYKTMLEYTFAYTNLQEPQYKRFIASYDNSTSIVKRHYSAVVSENKFMYGNYMGNLSYISNADTNKHTIKFNDNENSIYFDNLYIGKNTNLDLPSKSNVSLVIFATNTVSGVNSNSQISGKIWDCKIIDKETNKLVRNFIPCYRKSDNEIGLYDLVESVFYTNQGTGTFLKGNNKNLYKININIMSDNLFNVDNITQNLNEIKNIYLNAPLRKIGDYADYIDFKEGKIVRYIDINGSEEWIQSSNQSVDRFICQNPQNLLVFEGLSSHFIYSQNSVEPGTFYYDNSIDLKFRGRLVVNFSKYGTTTLSEFKQWLNENKPTFYNIKPIPTEELIELPEIPTINGTNIITINTKVSPSNIIITNTERALSKIMIGDKLIHEKGFRHIYGIKRSLTTTSPNWERMNESVNLIANATKDGSAVENSFDKLYPWNSIISKNIDISTGEVKAQYGDDNFAFDGSNGDVYTYIPTFWYKVWQDNENEYVQIANYPAKGFTESKEFYIARYQASVGEDSLLHSISGAETSTFKNIVTYRDMVKNIGDDYCLMDWRYFLIQLLYLVEYATYNSQSVLGNGISKMRHNTNDVALIAEENTNRFIVNTTAGNTFIVGQIISIGTFENSSCDIRTITEINDYSDDEGITGKEIVFDGEPLNITTAKKIWTSAQKTGELDGLGMKSGCLINDSKHAVIYRGIENIFANIPSFVDGININNRVAYICYDPAKYASDVFDGDYQKLGYTNLETSCYPKTLGFDENNPLVRFPTESGGSSTTGTSDYYYQATGKMVARVGGRLNLGTSCGLWFWILNTSSSNVSWSCGARVLKYK